MAVYSIGHAYGILRGGQSGNVEEARGFLNSMGPLELRARNKNEAKSRLKLRKRARKMGQRKLRRKPRVHA